MDLSHYNFGETIKLIFNHPMVRFALALLAADVLSGVGISLYQKTFKLGASADFLWSRALPYFLGAGGLQLVIMSIPPDYPIGGVDSALTTVVWGFVVAALVGQMLDNLRQMGLPIPEVLTAKKVPETKTTLGILLPVALSLSLFGVSACGKSAPVLVGESAIVASRFIQTASDAVMPLVPQPLSRDQALAVQDKLEQANNEIKKLIPVLRAIDAAQKAGDPAQANIEQALTMVQNIGTSLNLSVKGVPVAEAAAKLLEIVNNARGAMATIQATLDALKSHKSGDLGPSIRHLEQLMRPMPAPVLVSAN